MNRITLFTDQTDFEFIRDLQILLRETRSHILSVESAYCASIRISDHVDSELYMLDRRRFGESKTERIVEIRRDMGLVAVTALVTEDFEQQILEAGYHLDAIHPLPKTDSTKCRLRLVPVGILVPSFSMPNS